METMEPQAPIEEKRTRRNRWLPVLLVLFIGAMGVEGYYLYDMHQRLKNGYTEAVLYEQGQTQPANVADTGQGNGQPGTPMMATADPFAEIWTIHHIIDEMLPLNDAVLVTQPDLVNAALEASSVEAPLPRLVNKGDDFLVTMRVPGLKKSDIKTQIRGDTLTISGNQKNMVEKKQGDTVVANEQITRHFQSTFNLPGHVKADRMKVSYNHDLLTITLPKA